tara:strand:- start:232 stop:858 length:627 start_codon:yes stop_codon:yes gene_type:complete
MLASQYLRIFFRPLKKVLINLISEKLVKLKKPYYIYPEHFHPEASTSSDDFDLRNDISNVEKIRKAIPDSINLIYKIHPSQYGFQKFSEILALYNLKGLSIVKPNIDKKEILNKSCLGIISVNSTFVTDAAKREISSIVLGNYELFDAHKNILKSEIDHLEENLEYLSNLNGDELNKKWLNERLLHGFLWDEEKFIESFSEFLKVKYP